MLEAWTEWKDRCASGLCSEAARGYLHTFAVTRFAAILRRGAGRRRLSPPPDPWHRFEVHMTVKTTRQGKRYKDWLFARTALSDDPPLDVIQGGATLIMRDVVREFLRREVPAPGTLSLDYPLVPSKTGPPLTPLDVLTADADPLTDVCLREYRDLARKHAQTFLAALQPREQVMLIARHLGLSLADPLVTRLAGCRKTRLHTLYRALVTRTALSLRRTYPDDPADGILTLTLMTVPEMARLSFLRNRRKQRLAPLFMDRSNA